MARECKHLVVPPLVQSLLPTVRKLITQIKVSQPFSRQCLPHLLGEISRESSYRKSEVNKSVGREEQKLSAF